MNLSSSAAGTSSHPSLAPDEAPNEVRVTPFPYDELLPGSATRADVDAKGPTALAREVVPVTAATEAQAVARGREEGRAEARKTFDQQLAGERAAIAAALAQFTVDRRAYYGKVEMAVVQLSLAIARKILHREAQIDPLLLAGIVRVALEKIEGASKVRLRIHPHAAPEWQRYLASHMEPGNLPEFVEDAALDPDRCVLETSMGTAQLGVEVQLKEIEQGFMDLLAARPQEEA